MKFSLEYSKLSLNEFTTIRKKSNLYRLYSVMNVITPNQQFKAEIIERLDLSKSQITAKLALSDADCSPQELIAQLEKWYGKKFDDFVLLRLRKINAQP